MSYEQKDNSGSLFVNHKQQPGPKQPDRSGSALIDGVEYWVSGWLKQTKDGQPWLSLAFKRKEQRPQTRRAPAQKPSSGFDDMDSDIPF